MHLAGVDTLQDRAQAARRSRAQPDPLVPTVFHEPWWLDVATHRRWAETEVTENGRRIGRLPFALRRRRLGGFVIGMPTLTPFLGPAIDAGAGSGQMRWQKRHGVTRELIGGLPRGAIFQQKFHRGVTDVIPFQAERFDTAVQFTFEIDPGPEQQLWAALRDKHRNVIRKARREFEVLELTDCAAFTAFYERNLRERGERSWIPPDLMTALLAAAQDHGAGRMLAVRAPSASLAAAIFCPRDARSSYYSLSTRRADSGNGAVPLLIWEAVRQATADGLTFDFAGLASEGAIRLFAGFGGTVSPRYTAARSRAAQFGRLLRRRAAGFFGA